MNVTIEKQARSKVVEGDLAPGEQREQRAATFSNPRDLTRILGRMSPGDRVKFFNAFDLENPTVDSHNLKYITALGKACRGIKQFPPSAVLSAGLHKHSNKVIACGRFTETWEGDLGDARVVIKPFRKQSEEVFEKVKKLLWERAPVWRKLFHPNVLPFRGVDETAFPLSIVYDWGENGSITEYIASNSEANRPLLLLDVANGLEYLHNLDILHGNLKGSNVIIDQHGRACLTEYGLEPINAHLASLCVESNQHAVGTSRWLAPEIMEGMAGESKEADVFAFGMVAVEVFTGKIPFWDLSEYMVVHQIATGGVQEIPENAGNVGLTGEMRKLLGGCWRKGPNERPAMKDFVKGWKELVEAVIPEQ